MSDHAGSSSVSSGNGDLGSVGNDPLERVDHGSRWTRGRGLGTGPEKCGTQALRTRRGNRGHSVRVRQYTLDDARRDERGELPARQARFDGRPTANTPCDLALSREITLTDESRVNVCLLR